MVWVVALTEEQAEELQGELCQAYMFFNPVQDALGNWCISTEERDRCQGTAFEWVLECQVVPFIKPLI